MLVCSRPTPASSLPVEPLDRVHQGVGGAGDEERWREGQRLVGREPAVVHGGDEAGEAQRVEVADGRRQALVGADAQRIPAQGQDRPHAERPRSEQVGLERHDVAVAAGELEDRLDALVDQQHRAGHGGELDRGGLVVGHVDRVDRPGERAGARAHDVGVRVARRPELRGDDEATRRQRRSQHRAPPSQARDPRRRSGAGTRRGGGR